ncbi:Serine-threonine/tyrosine-protein kinase, catalytic domain [Dillenia turbinata]|uniref:Serine-threonine/tyrosine-protein kinase, catalytic domain n=1 Tax=Dillenia turbinata TaxID=194707 RepID=A0AAN8VRE2_9MAGN
MIGAVSALEYLHRGYSVPEAHCDLQPSNVLLDDEVVAQVSDFGIANFMGETDFMAHHTNTLATIGYMALEYGSEGIVSIEGDVYSFGIMPMETFTRKKPTDEMFDEGLSLKQWISESLSHEVTAIIDENLVREGAKHVAAKEQCIFCVMELALQCSTDTPM